MPQYNLKVARKKAQLEKMIDLENRNVCAFCPENIKHETMSKIDVESEHWFVKDNDYPYVDTKYHFLVISKLHVKSISELSASARQEFLGVVSLVEKKYRLKSYAIGMRSGDIRFNGASVEHLHAHIIVGNVSNPKHRPVKFKMSSTNS